MVAAAIVIIIHDHSSPSFQHGSRTVIVGWNVVDDCDVVVVNNVVG
jgi:hypothetical protein